MNLKPSIVFAAIVIFYSFIHYATKLEKPCEGDCAQIQQVADKIRNNRDSYIFNVQRCSRNIVSDTLCVYAKDTTGIDWNMIADSTCYFATQTGLQQQKVFIIKGGNTTDTVARRQCP